MANGAWHQIGWGLGRGVPSPANYGVWGSVVSSRSGVRKMHFGRIFAVHRTRLAVTSGPKLTLYGTMRQAASQLSAGRMLCTQHIRNELACVTWTWTLVHITATSC